MEAAAPNRIRLTELSHGSGCGCKIAPAELERILADSRTSALDQKILIGNDTSDDAAVVDIGGGMAVVSTTDFFMPIVDDPFDFGRIAAANAISDVYAMGGSPLTAIAILGWPVEKLGTEMAAKVLEGARAVCSEAKISLTGGHSIESKEPFFGLAVTGLIRHEHIKTNSGAKEGDVILLTKPIGTGMLAAALKRGQLDEYGTKILSEHMAALNSVGELLGPEKAVHAITDVTGFGLLGHLNEMCEGAQLIAEISFENIPLLAPEHLEKLIASFTMPDNTMRNFKAYSLFTNKLNAKQLQVLCDPQTSGGLLVAVDPNEADHIMSVITNNGAMAAQIGRFTKLGSPRITVI